MPICSAIRSPAIRASYFALLLDALNSNLKAYMNYTPSRFVRMSLAPDFFRHDDPSMNRVRGSGIASSTCVSRGGPSTSGLSEMKSAKTWTRMDVLVMTAIECAWKYLLILLKACTRASTNFSMEW
ncbi:hypothetical protein Tco_1390347 [Tanacetum coccineum]